MPIEVPDTPENMEICIKFCGKCPTHQSNKLGARASTLCFVMTEMPLHPRK
ncbi:hypothetical protein ACFL0D_07970 [Thermoproteota archaeon]